MSYDIHLEYKDENGEISPATVPSHQEGGTYAIGGTTEAWLNVTYNYSQFFYDSIDKEKGIRWLYGKKGWETIAPLATAMMKLGTQQDANYWKATPGNAGHALSILLKWAILHPNAVWEGD